MRFAIENVVNAKLNLTDRLIAATRPLEPAGADEELADEHHIETEFLSSEQDQ